MCIEAERTVHSSAEVVIGHHALAQFGDGTSVTCRSRLISSWTCTPMLRLIEETTQLTKRWPLQAAAADHAHRAIQGQAAAKKRGVHTYAEGNWTSPHRAP